MLTDLERARLQREGYPEQSIADYERFGARVALLYSFIHRDDQPRSGAVECLIQEGEVRQGTLISARSDSCRVLLTGDRRTATDKNGKERRVTRDVKPEAIRPSQAKSMKGTG